MSKERWAAIETEIGSRVIDRDSEIHGLILAALSGNHIVFLGPPGTAKSMMVRMLCEYLDASYFTRLMGKFTTPDEIFGAVDVPALKEGRYQRVIKGKLPDVQVAFLDEVFKSNSAILNSTLKVMQEREYDNDGVVIKCPLLFLVGASNELPDTDEGLGAVYDRFLLRYVSNYLDTATFRDMLEYEDGGMKVDKVSTGMFEQDKAEVDRLALSKEAGDSLCMVRIKLEEQGVTNSDRRYRQMIKVMAADSWMRGIGYIDDESVLVGEHILWQKPDDRINVARIVRQCINPIKARCQEFDSIVAETLRNSSDITTSNDIIERVKQLRGIVRELNTMGDKAAVTLTYTEQAIQTLMDYIV